MFHWLIFALVLVQFAIATVMPHIGPKTLPEGTVRWHLDIGATILFLIVLRLIWRLTHPVEALAAGPVWMQRTARIVHGVLYAVLILMPVLGWANASTRGFDVRLFGLIPLPKILPYHMKNGGLIGDIHNWIAWYVLIPIVVLHVAAAFYHHVVLRDGVLRRMTGISPP
jgi:cytochrome b561